MGRFLMAVRQQLPQVTLDRRDEEIEEIGLTACESLSAGKRTSAVVGEMREFGLTDPQARRMLTLARSTACRK